MVKRQKKQNFKKGFSLAAAIIVIMTLAIAVAATTPIITRKLANVKDAGSALGGGTHGRFEAYIKEIPCFGSDCYMKTDPQLTMTVYERLDDATYTSVVGESPTSNNNRKSTLYKEYSDAKPIINSDGNITTATIKINGSDTTITKGNKYIFEQKLTYTCVDMENPNDETNYAKPANKCSRYGNSIEPDNNNHRIIEGNMTEYKGKDSNDNKKLWLFKIANSPAPTVTTVPWYAQYSGTKLVEEGKIKDTDANGNPTATFTPPSNASNIVIHAVGGGGAGGGLNNDSGSYLLSSLSSTELNEIKKILISRVQSACSSCTSNVVTISNGNCATGKDSYWLCLDKKNNKIVGKTDVRVGSIYPDQVLDYTKQLGAQTQASLIYDMPNWFDYTDINTYSNSTGICAGAAACGGAGGRGSHLTIETNNCDETPQSGQRYGDDCSSCTLRDSLGTVKFNRANTSSTYCYDSNVCSGTTYTTYDANNTPTVHNCTSTSYDSGCYHTASNNQYFDFMSGGSTLSSSNTIASGNTAAMACAGTAESCSSIEIDDDNIVRNTTSKSRKYKGGEGGAKPYCAYAATKLTGRNSIHVEGQNYSSSTGENGVDETVTPSCTDANTYGNITTAKVGYGKMGASAYAIAGSHVAYSLGGTGGSPYIQTGQTFTIEGLDDLATNLNEQCTSQLTCATNSAVNALGTTVTGSSALTSLEYGTYSIFSNIDGVEINSCMNTCYSISTAISSIAGGTYVGNATFLNSTNTGDATNGNDGSKGVSLNDLDSGCSSTYIPDDGNPYNYIYNWTIPFTMNSLAYGEGGGVGEYKSTKVSKLSDTLTISLGKGGTWSSSGNSWKTSTDNASDGTDTTIVSGTKRIVTAKGGKGGKSALKTPKYDLCFQYNTNTCNNPVYSNGASTSSTAQSVNCCRGNELSKSTKEIISTAIKYSAFENIKSLTGNSTIVGIGLGRSGEGASTVSGAEEFSGTRTVVNSSGKSGLSAQKKNVLEQNSTGATHANTEFVNTVVKPSSLVFKGGDGAVIITW